MPESLCSLTLSSAHTHSSSHAHRRCPFPPPPPPRPPSPSPPLHSPPNHSFHLSHWTAVKVKRECDIGPLGSTAGGGGASLVERRLERVFDCGGRCWQEVAHYRQLNPAEYDAGCAAAAAAVAAAAAAAETLAQTAAGGPAGKPAEGALPTCRWGVSLQRALGDVRGGEELLASAEDDMRRLTLVRLRRSRRGRAALAELAGEVRRRFGPAVRVAREIVETCPEVECWARRLVNRPWPQAPRQSCWEGT